MAAIEHASLLMTTQEGHTGDTNWTAVPNTTLASSNFTAGKKYLLSTCVWTAISTGAANLHGARIVHGSTAFAESQYQMDGFGNAYSPLFWHKVWTAVASEGILVEHNTNNASVSVRTDQVSIIAINLEDDLTENTDWFSNEASGDFALSTAFQDGATITFTPGTAGDDWLILGYAQIDSGGGDDPYEVELERTGEASSTTPTVSYNSSSTTEQLCWGLPPRVFNLGSASNTFTIRVRNANAALGNHLHSAIFALNLNKFRAHASVWSDTAVDLGTSSYADQLSTASLDTEVTSDVWSACGWIFAPDTLSQFGHHRMQNNTSGSEADDPVGQTADNYIKSASRGTLDEQPMMQQTMTASVASGSKNYDSDADATVAMTAVAKQRSLFAVTMELAAAEAGAAPTLRTVHSNLRW